MKKTQHIKYALLHGCLALLVSVWSGCSSETNMDAFISASESDIELQYDGLTKAGQPGMFELGANDNWQIVSKPDWVQVSHAQGSRGRITISVTGTKNLTGHDRVGYIELELANGKPAQVSVFQHRLKENLQLTPQEFSLNILGLTDKGVSPVLKLKSNYPWKMVLTEQERWITPSIMEGEAGEAEITLTVEANLTKAQRTATIVIQAGEISQKVRVTQGAEALKLSATSLQLAKAGITTIDGMQPVINILAVEAWTVKAKPTWIACSPTQGLAGNTVMRITAAANSGKPRNGEVILVSAHGVEETITLSQDGEQGLQPDDKPVGHVYFQESFDWAHQVALLYPNLCQDQVGSVNGSQSKTIPVHGAEFTAVKAEFEKKLNDVNPTGNCLYVADGYIKMGRKNNQTGVMLHNPLSSIATGKMANVELSFDIAKNGTDNVTITVEIEGDGRVVGGETPLLSAAFVPINNVDKTKNWQWNSHKVTIKGVTANTKIIIRSTQWKTSGYHRWFLDNIKLTRVNING